MRQIAEEADGESVIQHDFTAMKTETTDKEPKKKIDNRPKKRKPGFHEQMFDETSYYFRNGLRYVYPYDFKFVAHVKGRWLGKKVIEVFRKEFHMESSEYYEKAIMSGRIRVNDSPVDQDRILTPRDILQTCVHRHEPPVLHRPIEFIENSDELVVINKPSSIPVHPCGRYRHNTIVFLLGKEHNLERLHTIHRIDRLTSGILMFAKTSEKARELDAQMKARVPEKRYLARVIGEFPSVRQRVDASIVIVSHKIGVCHVDEEKGKPCSTEFERLSYNGTTSVVQCIPHTGRMHQIRVHLQWLGYPIVNDPIYNHPTAWMTWCKDSKTKDMQKVIDELLRTRKDRTHDKDESNGAADDKVASTSTPVTDALPGGTPLDGYLADADVAVPTKRTKLDEPSKPIGAPTEECHGLSDLVAARTKEHSDRSTAGVEVEESEAKHLSAQIKSMDDSCPSTDNISRVVTNSNAEAQFEKDCIFEETDITIKQTSSIDTNTVSELSGRGAHIDEELVDRMSPYTDSTTDSAACSAPDSAIDSTAVSPPRYHYTSRDIGEEYHDDNCTYCQRVWVEPLESELVMYLHALSYEGPGWRYETEVPAWASDDFLE